jgi:hypothetical protein
MPKKGYMFSKKTITPAIAEGLNLKMATVQKRACGFRNRDNFKIAIYLHCGELDLYPASATQGKVLMNRLLRITAGSSLFSQS